jgi:hypothetical protein
MTPDQLNAIRMVLKIIVDTVNETPTGAPAGVMYAAMMAHGCSLDQFNQLTGALVTAGKIRRSGDCFYPVPQPQ